VLHSMGNPKPTAALLGEYGALTAATPPPQPQPTPPAPNYTGTVNGTFIGTVTLTPTPAK
jgi:hypothetical protein